MSETLRYAIRDGLAMRAARAKRRRAAEQPTAIVCGLESPADARTMGAWIKSEVDRRG